MTRINMDMDAAEAMFALAAIQAAGAKAHHRRRTFIETGAPIDETSIVETSAAMYDRLERRLERLLFPGCVYMHEDEPCDRDVAGYHDEHPYCRFHLALERGEYAQVTA